MDGAGPRTLPLRRARAMRDALAAMARTMVPGGIGEDQEGDVGRAMLEIAARLAEHSTRRLDQTPLRDKLAFLEMLDIVASPPRAATVPVVFSLADKRDEPVFAPPRVQLSAEGPDGEEVTFETRDALDLTPARLTRLIAADPALDRIELAPAAVIETLEKPPPPVRYELASAIEPGAKLLQLAHAVGIEPGDMLRLAGSVCRVEAVAGEIVALADAVAGAAAARAAVEKIVRLEAFALRDLREHVAYFGHKELLKLDGPAVVSLRFDPPGLAGRLAQLDAEFKIWGINATGGATEPGWEDLALAGTAGGALRLAKTWYGPIEELKLEAHKSRWIRIRLRSPIADPFDPDTRATSVDIKVKSEPPAKPAGTLGSRSIVSAFHNAVPLPVATAFLPFGPEPQRFDTFAIAAAEALSKPDAVVTVNIVLSEASPDALAFPVSSTDRAYGIGRDGRLQWIGFKPTGGLDWKQLGTSPQAAATSGSSGALRLDPARAFYAMDIGTGGLLRDLVFGADKSGGLWLGNVETGAAGEPLVRWSGLPGPTATPPTDFVLVPAVDAGAQRSAYLFAADSTQLYRRTASSAGSAEPAWSPVGVDPLGVQVVFTPPIRLAAARNTANSAVLVMIDSAGLIYRGDVGPGGTSVKWKALGTGTTKADSTIRPGAVLEGGLVKVVAVDDPNGEPFLVVEGSTPPPRFPLIAAQPTVGKPVSILCWPGLRDLGADQPLIVVTGAAGYLVWTHAHLADVQPLPAAVQPGGVPAALLRPPTATSPPSLLLNASKELLLEAPLSRTTQTVATQRYDVLWGVAGASYVRVGPSTTIPIVGPLSMPAGSAYPLASGVLGNAQYRLLKAKSPGSSFPSVYESGSTTKILIHGSDTSNLAAAGEFLRIGGNFYEINSIDTTSVPGSPTMVLLSSPGPGLLPNYFKFAPDGSPRSPNPGDIGTLIEFTGLASQPSEVGLSYAPPPSVPVQQGLIYPTAQPLPHPWALVDQPWTTFPTANQADLLGELTVGAWAQARLPRSSEHPELSWEYFDGKGWRRLAVADGTAHFAHTGDIVFTVPTDLQPTEIAGQEDHWVRARLVGGDYGRASYIVLTSVNQQSITVDRSRLNPPEILSIEADYALAAEVPPEFVLTLNNLATIDQTQASGAEGAQFALFEGVDEHVGDSAGGWRTLYLGFSKPPGVNVLALYADALDHNEAPRLLEGQVLTAADWSPVTILDETDGLTRPGRVQLLLTAAPAQRSLFGRDGWWIRLRPAAADPGWAPDLRGLFVNAAIAEQGKSVSQELLGSSLGQPDQKYVLAETPVLAESLDLRVRESLSDEEKAALEEASGDPNIVRTLPDIDGEWVRWKRVDSFVGLDGGARVYRLDSARGELRFGNGREGRIPPAGRDSIRAISYQAGGGAVGNVPAWAIENLKSSVESVETVFNPVEAGGGAEGPRPEQIAATGPGRLRHAGRALTPADVEALAMASAPDVVRARCFEGRGCSIDLAVAIRSADERCPVPSRARREGIARGLAEAGWGALGEGAIRVLPPAYFPVRVEARLLATRGDGVAAADHAARQALLDFLHPLIGGPDRAGWPFGQRVWRSDLQRLLAAVPGIDRVEALDLSARDAAASLDDLAPDALIFAGTGDIDVTVLAPGAEP